MKKTKSPELQQLIGRMENLKDVSNLVEMLHQVYKDGYLNEEHFRLAKVFIKYEHEETWDAAIQSYIESENNIVTATRFFDIYWENRNAPNSEGIDQPGLPEGRN